MNEYEAGGGGSSEGRGAATAAHSALSRRDFLLQTGKLGVAALALPGFARGEADSAAAQDRALTVPAGQLKEYGAGEVVLPFAYSMTTSAAAQPDGLDFSRQAGPDNCQVFARIDGELWEFRSQWIVGIGAVARYKGTDIDNMVRVEDGTYPAGMTACWFLGGMWYDAEERKLYAPMHVEQDGERRDYTNLRKIALGTSTDQGRTWRYEGDIITAETYYYPYDAPKFSGNAYGNGVADFGFYVDERHGYFYVFPDEGWSPKTARNGEMCWNTRAARCAIADRMAPGKWHYFHQGSWEEPALGGKGSAVSPGHLWGVVYSTALEKYLCVFPANEDPPDGANIDGVCVGCCSDLSRQDWVWGYCPEAMFGFLNLITPDGTDIARSCGDSFRYYAYFGANDFRRMDVTLRKGETRAVNIGLRYLFQAHPESSDPILGRVTKFVSSSEPGTTYSGGWSTVHNPSAYEERMRVSGKAGNSLEMRFTGQAIYWRAMRSPASGRADIYIDGKLRRTVDCYSPRSTTGREFTYFNRELTAGEPHSIRIVVRGEKHPDSKVSDIGHIAFEYGAESYRASTGFSSLMGKNNWHYQGGQGQKYDDLRAAWDDAAGVSWWSGKDGCRVGCDYQAPGEHSAAARRWSAPHNGTVRVEGNAGGAGEAAATIWINDRRLWQGAGQSATAHDLEVKVAQGDFLTFLVGNDTAGGYSRGSRVTWDPVITYAAEGNSAAVWEPNARSDKDLAANKYARSRTLVSTYRPFDAVDGTLMHPFILHADDPLSSGDDWFSVDLDRPCMIDRYVASFQSQDPRYVPRRFVLQRSEDGLSWTDVDPVADVSGERTTANCIPLLRVQRDVQPFRARYVRLYLPDGKPFAINGFELYRRRV